MNVILAAVIGVVFGTGVFLMLKRDLIRVVVGVVLVSNAVNLIIIAAGLSRGDAPIYPLPLGGMISDPLVQALVLTAIVISFGVSALLLTLIYRVYTTHRSLDEEELHQAEKREVAELEREREFAK